jgi:two-component system phosphate regulon sensor histidine kinase PhoR
MKQKSIGFIVVLMTVALLGVMAVQFFFIRQSYLQQSRLFDESVNASLSFVSNLVEKQEIKEYVRNQNRSQQFLELEQERLRNQVRLQQERDRLLKKKSKLAEDFRKAEEQLKENYKNKPVYLVRIENPFFETFIRDPKYHSLVRININYTQLADIEDSFVHVYAIDGIAPSKTAKDDSVRYLVLMNPKVDRSVDFHFHTLAPEIDRRLEREIEKIEQDMLLADASNSIDTAIIMAGKNPDFAKELRMSVILYALPLKERLNMDFVYTQLRQAFAQRNIHSPFKLEISEGKQLVYASDPFKDAFAEEYKPKNMYSTLLYPGDAQASSNRLTVYFPNKNQILLQQIWYMLALSLALVLVLIGCFGYTIGSILRQKKISEMKTDFINNMTHEFKTPVATIMIASETLKDPEIAADQKRVSKLANVIFDENIRLGNHIERVLNIARLEKQELKLEKEPIAMHSLIQSVVESMDLQFQKQQTHLHVQLDAHSDEVVGDELHLSNVLFNLIDNAMKYSEGPAHISIMTKNMGKQFVVQVADKGIGMSKDQLNKVFEQFYRVPTGNLHNVKGFGLGLSYVQDVIQRLQGKVMVKSEKDKGSVFEIHLPLLQGYVATAPNPTPHYPPHSPLSTPIN